MFLLLSLKLILLLLINYSYGSPKVITIVNEIFVFEQTIAITNRTLSENELIDCILIEVK